MTDFGANIFDNNDAPAGRPRKKRKSKGADGGPQPGDEAADQQAMPPAKAARAVQEVPLTAPPRVHADTPTTQFDRSLADQPVPANERAEASEPSDQPVEQSKVRAKPSRRSTTRARKDQVAAAPDTTKTPPQHTAAEPPRAPQESPKELESRQEPGSATAQREPERARHGGDRPDRRTPDSRHNRSPQSASPHGGAARAPADARRSAPARINLLVDLPALQKEAREQGGELAVTRLRAGLAGSTPVETAICFFSGPGRPPVGFEVIDAGDATTAGSRFAAKATELAARGLPLVLAPASDAMVELAHLLRRDGHRIELAGLVVRDDGSTMTRRLARACVFVP